MRLEKYIINEGNVERVHHTDIDEIAVTLKRDCAPYLTEFGTKSWFYRGYKFTYKNHDDKFNILKKKPRRQRQAMNMSKDIQDWLNEYYKKKFGWKARQTGVFTTTSSEEAGSYGNTQIFIPIGAYKYIYNPEVRDLYIQTPASLINIQSNGTLASHPEPSQQKRIDKWEKSIWDFKDKGLNQYNGRGIPFEVIWKCKEYYMIDSELDMYNNELSKALR